MPTSRQPITDDDRFYLTPEGLAALLDTEAAIVSVRLSDGQETAYSEANAQTAPPLMES